jgi:hypothetical protein
MTRLKNVTTSRRFPADVRLPEGGKRKVTIVASGTAETGIVVYRDDAGNGYVRARAGVALVPAPEYDSTDEK